jgi:hypothetical protein
MADGATCWITGKDAHAQCAFCGRYVNKEVARTAIFPMTAFVGKGEVPKLITVRNAIWCGLCKPRQEPTEMPEIY